MTIAAIHFYMKNQTQRRWGSFTQGVPTKIRNQERSRKCQRRKAGIPLDAPKMKGWDWAKRKVPCIQTDGQIGKVREFMQAFGQDTPTKPSGVPEHVAKLRHSLIKEEFLELVRAQKEANTIEIADALADILYVALGGLVDYGATDVRTPPLRKRDVLPDTFSWLVAEIGMHTDRIRDALVCGGPTEIVSRLNHIAYAARSGFVALGLRGDAIFDEVHRSNMAKLWSNAEVAEKTGSEIKFYKTARPGFYVAIRSDGKIIKPPSWTKPDIKGVM